MKCENCGDELQGDVVGSAKTEVVRKIAEGMTKWKWNLKLTARNKPAAEDEICEAESILWRLHGGASHVR